jgi:uncharacterized protein YbbC (DUF1343 family)
MRKLSLSILLLFFIHYGCAHKESNPQFVKWSHIKPGDARFELYLPKLKSKKVGVLANHSSMIGNTHLVDLLLTSNIKVQRVFSPEHGFRGKADAGAIIKNETDVKTGLHIVSLYGKHKKPTKDDLHNLDIIVFDLQDVGTRFYTYVSTMCYMMEACAENNIPMIILDRPNPNGFYVDGPILESKYKSFVGMHNIPIVHGLTLGEYALMVNGEGWLKNKVKCELDIIKVKNYTHKQTMALPIKPSPNLPNYASILLYPSLCLFEGTIASIGRGTSTPFQIIGHPDYPSKKYSFEPISTPGASLNPKLKNKKCFGFNLTSFYKRNPNKIGQINLNWIIDFYKKLSKGDKFFISYFEKLSGTSKLREQIKKGLSEKEIKQTWKKDIEVYKKIRIKYLLYPDFE